jgi:hypothetical protein
MLPREELRDIYGGHILRVLVADRILVSLNLF